MLATREVGVAVSTVKAAHHQHLVQQGSSGDDEVQLVPVTRSGVPPGHPVVGLGGEEGVVKTQVVVGTELKEALAVPVKLDYAKMADAARPGVMVGTQLGVEVSKQEQVFLGRDLLDLRLQLFVELVLDLRCAAERGGVDA